jgi:uncharacterized protein with PIN domain
MKPKRERCDRCNKWTKGEPLSTLEETVSEGLDCNFAICQKCMGKYSKAQWDTWAQLDHKTHPEWREA